MSNTEEIKCKIAMYKKIIEGLDEKIDPYYIDRVKRYKEIIKSLEDDLNKTKP